MRYIIASSLDSFSLSFVHPTLLIISLFNCLCILFSILYHRYSINWMNTSQNWEAHPGENNYVGSDVGFWNHRRTSDPMSVPTSEPIRCQIWHRNRCKNLISKFWCKNRITWFRFQENVNIDLKIFHDVENLIPNQRRISELIRTNVGSNVKILSVNFGIKIYYYVKEH